MAVEVSPSLSPNDWCCLKRNYVFSIRRSPPERPWAPCSVPTVGSRTVHCHCCVIILGNLLLNSELLVTLVFRFATDVSNACFLVFINVKNVSIYGGALDFVRRQGGKHLLL